MKTPKLSTKDCITAAACVVIYFTADSLGDYFFDEASLEVTIAPVAKRG